jgi:DNA replication protein DnaC
VSIFVPTSAGTQTESAQQIEFRRQLDAIPSWAVRAQKIEDRLQETIRALAARNEQLFALRGDFDSLTMDFWNAFARRLGCENPSETIARQQAWQRSVGRIGTILFFVVVTLLLVVHLQTLRHTGSAVSIGVLGAVVICMVVIWPMVEIARAQRAADILSKEQEPFWLTGGSVALSNLGITPPPGAQWWWTGRVAFVFVRSLAARFSVDALGHSLIWEDCLMSGFVGRNNGLTGQGAAGILQHLLTTNFRYRRMVETFHTLSSLDEEYFFLEALKTEVEQKVSEELRAAELRVEELRSTQARGRRQQEAPQNAQEPRIARQKPAVDINASWETLVIPPNLKETLQAYCKILRNYKDYQAEGVHLPKGLLLHGPPGCGKTQIAKTLSAKAGLHFIALSTSDCKAMWLGHSADRLATVFSEARDMQPTLLFIDELDAVCPPRGAYADAISQEFTAQLLQEVDGLLSDSQAVFLVGATNRLDWVDSAILSRFAEKIEIPLPDEVARQALLKVFLGPIRFAGDREQIIRALTQASDGQSGRDLRALVNGAVLAAVKRTSSPKDFTLIEKDFSPS